MFWIIQQQELVPPGRYQALLERHGVAWSTCHLHQGDPLPVVERGDGILVLGGTMGAYETETYPWLTPLKGWMREAAERGVALLAICLGAQLLADELGGTVSANTCSERGICRVHLAQIGGNDPLFKGIPHTLHVLQWHNDSFTLPPGSTLLATSQACPVQAFRYRNACAIQFHPEVDSGIVARWNSHLSTPADYPAEFEAARGDWQALWDRIFENFLAHIET